MNFYNQTKEQYLYQAGLRINNSLGDETVKSAVALYGYTEEKLNAGRNLLQQAEEVYEIQKKEYGDLDAAQAELDVVKRNAHEVYMVNLRIAKIAFKNNVQAQSTLDLNTRRATTFSGWLKQTLGFYHALLANENWLNSMNSFGITTERIQDGLNLIEDVNEQAEQVKKEKGDAQNATQLRDMKFEELHDWISDYEEIAKIALADKPQLLEKLGIVVKS